ncbi:right-handed parallel beta-helix repeat-containing protein [Megasphaera sp.]|uniref:right-handed parallel beta-helix repeat-containing protein n=1 Tax=Megasphaera sp. TaxID=2023260 RepID=UPI00257F8741|nr:right-handed parallel beta-helix repeat-containing protein [Megasphaera sp.]MCI7544906.1 right-handed parallel beta-helix repeat-containing protein [Megasphaera elsdenii]MDY4727786.1 right-handed parallel beta-helix repeat-containing protein [Megasphaera elsdenii]
MMKQFGKTKWTGLLRCALLTLLLVMMMAPTALGARRTVLVHNVREMMEALGDHTEIILAPGQYNLSAWLRGPFADPVIHNFAWNPISPPGLYRVYHELELAGFQDLTIRGQDTGAITAEIVTEDPYSSVFKFLNCQQIRLAHLRFGHIQQEGHCTGAVLNLEQVKDASLDHLDLYGCGTYGYEARRCKNILLRDSVIRGCTYGLVSATECQNLKIVRTTFKDTSTNLSLFEVNHSRLELLDCTFQNVLGKINSLDMTEGKVIQIYEI